MNGGGLPLDGFSIIGGLPIGSLPIDLGGFGGIFIGYLL
jgi:hypothetical protein